MARNIKKKLDANGRSFGHLTLILLLDYLVKCRNQAIIERAVGMWQQRLPRAFVLEEDNTCCNKDDVMRHV